MKLSILFSSLAVLIATPVRADHIKVFLLAGQSNMAGSGTLVSALPTTPSNLQMPQDDILFYTGSELAAAFGTLQPGGGDTYGPEITFGRAIADALPHQKFGIIKHGRSVTSLYSAWYAPNGGEYVNFRSTVSYGLDAFARAGHTCEIVGMLWTQGESDASNGRTTAQYEADLIAFIADIRSRYGANLPFYLSRLSINQTNVLNIGNVRAAQENVANADPFTYMIDADSFLVRSDGIHFSGPGQIALGQAFAQAWLTNSIEATAPGLSTLSPAHSATAIDPTTNLSITFSENITFGTGAITLRQSGGALVESFNVATPPANLTISGSTLTINPTSLLSPSTGYYLEIDATAIDDLVGNSYPGISGPGTWSFTTSAADNTPPGISSLSPAHSATGVLFNSNLRITFTENIAFGTGEIRLRQSGGALVQSFDVANPPAGLSLSGATVTINPSAELAISTGYYLEIDATAIVDHAGNSFAGFSGNGTWSFTATAGLIPGSQILATASAINARTDHPYMTVNGSGLSGGVHSSAAPSTVWSTGTVSPANVWIQWDLGSSYLLDSIHAWNHYTAGGDGIKSVDIYYSNAAIPGDPEGVGASNWTKLGGAALELPVAPATNNTGFDLATATSTTLPTTEVRYVRFELNSNWGGNRTGLAEIQFTVKPIGPDTTAPSVSTLSPTHTATGVATSSNLSVTFNENVAFGTGAIRLRRQSDNALIESFDVASPPSGLSLSGATVTLNPTADLANLTAYYVEIDATAIIDLATNSFPGITGNGTWSFTTVGAETVPPTTSSLSPAHNATGISYASNLSINFSENVAFGSGAIRLRRQSDNSVIESFDVASPPSGLTISGTTVTLNPASDLSPATTYYVEIDATAIDDLAGNSFAGFSGSGTWSFTTFVPDTTPPTIGTRNPANAATGVPASSNLVITFSENVAFGTGAIRLCRQSDSSVIESFDVANPPSGLTLSGASVTLNPTSNLDLATTYYVEIDATAIDDLSANSFAGFSGNGTWSFTTTVPDTTPPTISTLNPANGATGVSQSGNLSIIFNENIAFGTGAITLRQSNGTLVESFNVASPPSGLSLSGVTVTLNPSSDLDLAASYYVEIDATAIKDQSNNSFAGISGNGTWSFTISNSAQSTFTLADSYLASLDVSSATSLFVTPGFPSFLDGPLIGSSDLTITGFFSSSNNQLSLVNNTGNSFTGNIIVDRGALRIAGSPFASNGGFVAGSMTASNMITINRAGTLFIDDTVTGGYTADRFGTGASSLRPAVVMNGGAFSYTGANNAAVMTQTLGDLTLNAGLSTFTVNRTSNGTPTLVFDSLIQASGSIVLFVSNTTIGSAATNVAKITFTNAPAIIGGSGAEGTNTISLVKGAKTPTAGGNSNFFVYGANGIRPLALGTETDDRGFDINGATTTANVRLNDSTASTITALSGPTTVNSLIIGGAAVNTAQTWAMGNTLTLTSGMLLRTFMNSSFTFTSGTLTAGDGTNPADLSISVPNGTMFIGGTANISNNGSSVVSLVVPDSMTISSTANSTYSGGTYVLGGTVTLSTASANTRQLGAGKVFVKGGILNLNNIGATSFSGSLANPNYTVTDGGRIGIASVNHGSAEFFNIEANSIIGGGSGSGTGLASLTRGTNITLAPGAIIQHNALTAALNLTTGTIQNLGTAADLYYGINNNQNNVSGSINIGNGTAFMGISTDRSGRAWQQGTINIASGTTSVDFQGHATHGTAAVLTLGNGVTAGDPVIVFAGTGTVDINALGALTLNDDAAVYGNQNVRFVAKAGSTLTVTAATGMGSGTGIASVLVNNGGILAIGASNALNGAVTVEAGGQFNANLAGGLTGDGALTFNDGSILNIVSQALAFSGAQASAATINPGTLVKLSVGSFGTTSITLDSVLGSGSKNQSYLFVGNQALDPSVTPGAVYTLNKSISGVGGILTNDAAARSISALTNGKITLGANGGVIAATTGTTLTVAENISGGALTIGTTAIIDGAPKQGIVSLTATTNDYTGGTTIHTGTLTMGGAYTVLGSNSGSLTVNGGTLNMAGNSLTVGNLTGTGGVISGTVNARTLTIGQGDFGGGDFQGSIQNGAGGSTALTKTGGGTITLSGANSYTGITTISAGTLFIDGNQTSANGAVSVAANATLGGTGTIGGSATIAATGKLEFDISTAAGSHDKLDLAAGKTLTFSGASVLTITSSGGASPGIYTLLTAPGGITGSAPATLNLPNGWVASVSISGNDLQLNVTSTGVTLDHFAISTITSPQTVGTAITGITITAQDVTNATFTSFTGTVTFGGTAGVSGTSANFVNGVLSGVSVTPTVAGTDLTLTVNDGSSHFGSATFTVQSVFDDWASGSGLSGLDAVVGANPDGDSLTNLEEFAFGMNPGSPVTAPLSYVSVGTTTSGVPILEKAGATYRAVFARRKDHQAAGINYEVAFSADLTAWTPAVTAPERLSGVNADPVEAVGVDFPLSVDLDVGGTAPPKFFRVTVTGN